MQAGNCSTWNFIISTPFLSGATARYDLACIIFLV